MATSEAILLDRADERFVPSGMYRLSARAGGEQHVDGFWLDRHLVTVDRYAEFIESGGYEEQDFWDDEGWLWLRRERIACPRFWEEAAWARFLRKNRPVVGVSHHEASAFARFEGRRLPTEREIEAASRGPEGFTYTWGHVWEEGRIGVRGVGPRMTWPVGYFRRAKGPFGHDDLIGNVWQWTADPGDPRDPNRTRVVRGGSWASRPDQNTTDSWNAYAPTARFSHLGFRTARV
jgi:formylglycine-generating enzyme required for sulfatase activity